MRETQTSLCSSTQLLSFSLLSVQLISCASTKAVLLLQRIIRGRAFGPHCSPWLGGNMSGFAGFNVSLLLFGWQVSESHVWRERKASVTQSVLTASQLQHWKGQLGTSRWRKYDASLSEWWSSKMYGLLIFVDINWHSKDLEVKPAAVRGKSRSTRTVKVLTSSTSYAQLSGSPKPPRGWKRRGKLRGHQEVTGRSPGGHREVTSSRLTIADVPCLPAYHKPFDSFCTMETITIAELHLNIWTKGFPVAECLQWDTPREGDVSQIADLGGSRQVYWPA